MSICECAPCGRVFTGLAAFDRHQSTAYGTPEPVTCHDPASRGLVRQASGRWGFPATAASRLRVATLRAERGRPGISGTPDGPGAAESRGIPVGGMP